jgi:hypothetical protein
VSHSCSFYICVTTKFILQVQWCIVYISQQHQFIVVITWPRLEILVIYERKFLDLRFCCNVTEFLVAEFLTPVSGLLRWNWKKQLTFFLADLYPWLFVFN